MIYGTFLLDSTAIRNDFMRPTCEGGIEAPEGMFQIIVAWNWHTFTSTDFYTFGWEDRYLDLDLRRRRL